MRPQLVAFRQRGERGAGRRLDAHRRPVDVRHGRVGLQAGPGRPGPRRGPRAGDGAVGRIGVDRDVGREREHLLLLAELLAVRLHGEADDGQPDLAERAGGGRRGRQRAVRRGRRRPRRQQLVLQLLRGGDQGQRALDGPLDEHARDEQPVDLVRPLEDAVHPRIAVVALGRVVPDEPVAAVDLHVLVEHLVQRLAARHLEDRRLDGVLLQRAENGAVVVGVGALEHPVEEAHGAEDHRLERVGAGDHAADLVLDGAEAGYRLPELPPAGRVARRFADGAPRAAGGRRAQLEAAVVEHVEGDLVALADFAEQVAGRNPHVLQDHRRRRRAVQAHLVFFLAGGDPVEPALDEERREVLAVHPGEDDVEVGEPAVGDPHLLAVEDEAAVRLARRAGPGPERVRAGAGLAQAVGADGLPGHQGRQVALLLLAGAEHPERQDGEVGVRPVGGAERSAPAQGAGDDGRAGLVQRQAPVGLRHVGAEQAQLAGAAQQLAGQIPVLRLQPVVLPGDLVGELLRRPLNQPVLLGHALRREDGVGLRRLQEPLSAARYGLDCGGRHDVPRLVNVRRSAARVRAVRRCRPRPCRPPRTW